VLSPAPVLVVGTGTGPGQDLFGVVGAVRLRDGTLVVADNGSHELRWFDRAGRLRSRSPGEGSGPGEFRNLQSLLRLPGDTLAAYDVTLRRLSLFAPDGRFVRSAVLQAQAGAPLPAAEFGDGTLLVREAVSYSPGSAPGLRRDSVEFARYGTDGSRIATLGRFPGSELYVESRDGRFSVSIVPFARGSVAAAGGGRFFFSSNEQREVRAFTAAGARVEVLREPERPLRVTEREMAGAIERLASGTGPERRRALERQAADLPGPRTHPAYRGLKVDPEGFLWAAVTPRPGTDRGRWSVFDRQGARVQDLPGPALVPLDVGSDYLLGLRVTEDGEEEVVVHSLTRPAGR
jgi:hypothetical protein